MPSTNKENQRIKTRSSSSISRSGRLTNTTASSSTIGSAAAAASLSPSAVATTSQTLNHHHYHHRHQPPCEHTVRPLGKTKNSKIYFSDSDDDNGQQTPTPPPPPTTIEVDRNSRQAPQPIQQKKHYLHHHDHKQKQQLDVSATIFRTSTEQLLHGTATRPTSSAAAAAAALDELNSGQSTDNDHTVNALLIIGKHRRNNNNNNSKFNKKNMIIHYGREFICVLALILTTYATFQNVPPKISKIAAPKPFFPKGSLVHDHPGGHLDHVQNRVVQSELSLVMFYAPWCAESQYARNTYEFVARRFYREAHFAAINCWQPGGECRHQYAKILEWPVVMAYLQNGLAVPYNGKWTRTSVTKFITSLLHPIRRVTNTEDLLDLMMVHDAVVVGFIDVNTHPSHYRVFYQTAIKWLEKDPYQEVGFAVVTGESGKIFGVDGPLLRTYLWNGTMEYEKTVWTQPNLHQWVSSRIQVISQWVTPPGSKANTLAPFLKRGPVMMLFTPRNLQSDSIDAYTMLRQIGLEYFNCPSVNQDWIKEMSRTYIAESRRDNAEKHVEFLRKCDELVGRTVSSSSDRLCQPTERRVSISFGNIVNSSKLQSVDYCPIGPRRTIDEYYSAAACTTSGQFLHHERHSECASVIAETFADPVNHPISMLKTEYDNRAAGNLLKIAVRKKCETHFSASLNEDAETLFFDGLPDQANNDKILGMACKSNRTLSLIAIDSILYHTFAERLGVDVLQAATKSAAIILDHEYESTYTLNEPINSDSLVDFVYNFSSNMLKRHLKNTAIPKPPSQPSQPLPVKDTPKTQTKNRSTSRAIRLRDIDSAGFTEHVLLSNRTVVVLFYSVQCALCSIMTQSVLMTSKILSELVTHIDFVRIDGDRNDLPWQYTMDKFPSLIVFDAKRKSESRIFPSALEVTVQNVVGFVLANLNRPLRLHGFVSVCKNVKKLFPIEDCLAVLRKDTIANISVSLREWRKLPYKRGQILRRLQALQRFYLHLFRIDHSCDFNSLDVFVRDIGRVWTM